MPPGPPLPHNYYQRMHNPNFAAAPQSHPANGPPNAGYLNQQILAMQRAQFLMHQQKQQQMNSEKPQENDKIVEIDQEKVNEERRAYLEEARSQEAFD